jgi:hypothetical protein
MKPIYYSTLLLCIAFAACRKNNDENPTDVAPAATVYELTGFDKTTIPWGKEVEWLVSLKRVSGEQQQVTLKLDVENKPANAIAELTQTTGVPSFDTRVRLNIKDGGGQTYTAKLTATTPDGKETVKQIALTTKGCAEQMKGLYQYTYSRSPKPNGCQVRATGDKNVVLVTNMEWADSVYLYLDCLKGTVTVVGPHQQYNGRPVVGNGTLTADSMSIRISTVPYDKYGFSYDYYMKKVAEFPE